MDDDAVSSRPHLIRVAWSLDDRQRIRGISIPYTFHTKWRMVDTHLERKRFTSLPIVIIARIYCGAWLDKDTFVKVGYLQKL